MFAGEAKAYPSLASLEMHAKSERSSLLRTFTIYDNDFTSIINIYFYETFSTPNSSNKHLHFTL